MLKQKYPTIIGLDTETTGINSISAIIELAYNVYDTQDGTQTNIDDLVKLEDGQLVPWAATAVNHITNQMLDHDGVTKQETSMRFYNHVSKALKKGPVLLVAYNASFDITKIQRMLEAQLGTDKSDEIFQNVDILDPLSIDKDYFRYPNKLVNAIAHWEAENVVNSHRANDDVDAMMVVLDKMEENGVDVEDYVNLIGFYPQYALHAGDQIKQNVTYRMQPSGWPKYQPGEFPLPVKDKMLKLGEKAEELLADSDATVEDYAHILDTALRLIRSSTAIRNRVKETKESLLKEMEQDGSDTEENISKLEKVIKEEMEAGLQEVSQKYHDQLTERQQQMLGTYYIDGEKHAIHLQDYSLDDLARLKANAAMKAYLNQPSPNYFAFKNIDPNWATFWCQTNTELDRRLDIRHMAEVGCEYHSNPWGDPVFTDKFGQRPVTKNGKNVTTWNDAVRYYLEHRSSSAKENEWNRAQFAARDKVTFEHEKTTSKIKSFFQTSYQNVREPNDAKNLRKRGPRNNV